MRYWIIVDKTKYPNVTRHIFVWCDIVHIPSSQWRHNGRDGVWNQAENTIAPLHWPLWGEPPVTGGFPSQRASNTENVSIWWRHHVLNWRHRFKLLATYQLWVVYWLPCRATWFAPDNYRCHFSLSNGELAKLALKVFNSLSIHYLWG